MGRIAAHSVKFGLAAGLAMFVFYVAVVRFASEAVLIVGAGQWVDCRVSGRWWP